VASLLNSQQIGFERLSSDSGRIVERFGINDLRCCNQMRPPRRTATTRRCWRVVVPNRTCVVWLCHHVRPISFAAASDGLDLSGADAHGLPRSFPDPSHPDNTRTTRPCRSKGREAVVTREWRVDSGSLEPGRRRLDPAHLPPLCGHATGALRKMLRFVIGGGRGLTHSARIDRSPLPKVRTDQLVEILDKETTSMQAGMAPHRGGERLHSGAVATVPGKWYTPSALAATEEIAVRPGITPSSRGRGAA